MLTLYEHRPMLRDVSRKRTTEPKDEWVQKEPRVRKSASTYEQEWQQFAWQIGFKPPPYRRPKPEPKRDQS